MCLMELAHIAFAYTGVALSQAVPQISVWLKIMTCVSSLDVDEGANLDIRCNPSMQDDLDYLELVSFATIPV